MMALANQSESAGRWSVEQYDLIFADSTPRRIALVVGGQSLIQGFLVASVLDLECEIENIVVANSERRNGFGKQLLNEFLRVSRGAGAKTVFLEVRQSNLAARTLYERASFVESGRRQGYYKEPEEDAILYQKFLT
jgi:ribosomal-protein-alanine N-acetyltransferase